MKQYLLSVYHPEVPEAAPPPENMEEIFRDVAAVNEELNPLTRGCSAAGCTRRVRPPWCGSRARRC